MLELTPWAGPSMVRLRQALGLGSEPRLIDVAGSAVADWNLYDAVYGNSFGSEPNLAEAVDNIVYLGYVEAESSETDPAVWEEPEYRAARARRAKLMREYGELFQAEDFEGFREWSDYSCEE